MGAAACVLAVPYIAALLDVGLQAASARTHLSVPVLLVLSVAQSIGLLGVAVFAGQWAAWKLGLGAPLIAMLVLKQPWPPQAPRLLLSCVVIGVVIGLALAALDHWGFRQFGSVAELSARADTAGLGPLAWQGFLASFYGGIAEEILMRLGLLSLLALSLGTLTRLVRGNADRTLPNGVFWAANILVALVFGLGHLPATAAIMPLTPELVARALVLNGIPGLVFGVLYRDNGLERAMLAHFSTDIVLHGFLLG